MGKGLWASVVLLCSFVALCFIGLAGCSTAGSSGARNASEVVREEIPVRRLDAQQGKHFQEVATAWANARRDLPTLQSLLAEKQQETKSYDKQLRGTFGIDPTKSYHLDAKAHQLYLLQPGVTNMENAVTSSSETNRAPDSAERTLMRDYSEDEFASLSKHIYAKRITAQQISALRLLVEEKNRETALLRQIIEKTYGLDLSRNYRFDPESNSIFQR